MAPVASTSTATAVVDTVPLTKKARKDSHSSTAAAAATSSAKKKSDTNVGRQPSTSVPPLGKFLASSEKHIRDKAVASLTKFLSAGQVKRSVTMDEEAGETGTVEDLPVGDLNWDKDTPVDKRLAPLEMAKLWKGIFFCFWMSDKPLVQQALASDLARLTLDVRPKKPKGENAPAAGRVERFRAAMTYLRGFWEAIVREWSGLDKWRLDKFYLLIRRFVHASFLLLQREAWDPRAIDEYNAMLCGPGGPLDVTDDRLPASVVYHLADIYLAELERVYPTPPSSRELPLIPILDLFLSTLAKSPSATLFKRVNENVGEPLLSYTLPPAPPSKTKKRKIASLVEEPEWPGIVSAALEVTSDGDEGKHEAGMKVLRRVFQVAGGTEATEPNRRRMYDVVKKWEADRAVEL